MAKVPAHSRSQLATMAMMATSECIPGPANLRKPSGSRIPVHVDASTTSIARAADGTGLQKSGAASRGIQTLSHSLTHELVAGSRSYKCVYEHIASPPSHDSPANAKHRKP
jgi:hypothetical protein